MIFKMLLFTVITFLAGCNTPSENSITDVRDDVVYTQPKQKPKPWQPTPETQPSGCWDGGCHIDDSGMIP